MLKLYYHPLASFCHKALIALYENGTPFEPVLVDLADEPSRAQFLAVWPTGKMPVLRDEARGHTVAESTIVVEYLDTWYPGLVRLIPDDRDLAWQARMWDRYFDHYVHHPMQKVVLDQLRAPDDRDPAGVREARARLRASYGELEAMLAGRKWVLGDEFSLADCSAAPALFYADLVEPIGAAHPRVGALLDRLMARPSYARALDEAEPFFENVPLANKPRRKRA